MKREIREELKKLKTEPRDLRRFGLTVGTVFGLLAGWLWFRHKPYYPVLLIPAVLLLGLGVIYPKSLKRVYRGWMAIAFVLGHVVSTVLLTVFFFLIVMPIGLLARCFGQDFLDRKFDRQVTSYWRPRDATRPSDPSRYEQQF